MITKPQTNQLLAGLSPQVQGRLFCHLEPVLMPLHTILYDSGCQMHHVYFPADTTISIQYLMQNGDSTGISMVGNEGLLGSHLFMGGESTPNRSVVQSAGYAYRLPKQILVAEFNHHGEFMMLLLRYVQGLITQVSQVAACNRHHSIDQQLCRWLLLSMDRMSGNHLTMTQEFIADMLGVRREGVSHSAHKLHESGVISYTRGLITVLDRQKLEGLSCECYSAVKGETEKVLHDRSKCNQSRVQNPSFPPRHR